MERFTSLEGVAVPFPKNHVDTDVIYPGRFLSTIQRQGLGHCTVTLAPPCPSMSSQVPSCADTLCCFRRASHPPTLCVITALLSLFFVFIHTEAMILAFDAYRRSSWMRFLLGSVLLHMTASVIVSGARLSLLFLLSWVAHTPLLLLVLPDGIQ